MTNPHDKDFLISEDDLPALNDRKAKAKHLKTKSKAKKILLIVLIVLISLVLVAAASFFVLREIGRRSLLGYDDVVITPSDVEIIADETGKNVTYNGHTYVFNEDVTSILCMGVDRKEFSDEATVPGASGQADALFLFAMDTKTGKSTVIAVSRDSMVDIDLYSAEGAYIGTEKNQLCLAYSYGDGRKGSCENTLSAVSRLMYGIPINSYVAIDFEAVGVVNDKIGGVEITSDYDIKLSDGSMIKSGQTVTLKGEDAITYLRARDKSVLESNNDRVKRQQKYLKSFANKIVSATKSDITVPVKLYNSASEYMVSNIGVPEITYFTSCLMSGGYSSNIDFRSIPGTVAAGEDGKAEFTPDGTAMYELILEVFYTQIN
jgi:LCP family protein required for cell wall assembly